MGVPDGEETNVTAVQIFKSHDDHHEYIQGQFLFQLTDYIKTNGTMIPLNRSTSAAVPFGITPLKLSSRSGLLELVYYSVLDSKSFSDLTSDMLAEKITARILSRFRFMPTTSCSNIILTVNVARIYKGDFNLQLFKFDHDEVSSSFGLLISENIEEDMDDGDNGDSENDEEGMDDDNASSENDEEGMDDDNASSENDEEGMDDGSSDNDDNNDGEYYNSFSGLEEDYCCDIKGFSEVTGLVSVKPHELDSMDCCSICMEEYGSDNSEVAKAETSVCSHIFHRDCIHQWLRKFSNRCPLCRSVFIAQI